MQFSLGGGVIKSIEKDYQVVKREMEYHGYGEEYNVEKRKSGSNIIFSLILLGRISSEGKGTIISGKKIKMKNNGGGKE